MLILLSPRGCAGIVSVLEIRGRTKTAQRNSPCLVSKRIASIRDERGPVVADGGVEKTLVYIVVLR